MFETRERFRSAKERLFRLIKGLEKESSKSLSTPVFTVAPYETVNSRPSKAEVLMYRRMFDQLK